MVTTSNGKNSRRQVEKQAVTPPRVPKVSPARAPKPVPVSAPAPTPLSLQEQKLDFTAEGSPPPGKVATEAPLTEHDNTAGESTAVPLPAPEPGGKRGA